MPVVADIPEEFDKALEAFRPHFGAPPLEHFKYCVLGLIVSENVTVKGINRIFIQAKHPSSLNRFLTAGIWKQQDVTRIDILQTQGALGEKGWLGIDDTLTHKTGKKKEGVGISWDHGENRYVLAHNIVTGNFSRTREATVLTENYPGSLLAPTRSLHEGTTIVIVLDEGFNAFNELFGTCKRSSNYGPLGLLLLRLESRTLLKTASAGPFPEWRVPWLTLR